MNMIIIKANMINKVREYSRLPYDAIDAFSRDIKFV